MAPFQLPQPVKPLASPLMRLEEVAIGYAADRPVLTGLNLRIDQDDRIALLGQNGNGKSTFAKLIAGKLAPLAGKVFGAKRVDVGLFRPAPARRAEPAEDALRPHAGPDAGGDGGAAARAARQLRLLRRQGRHQMRQPVGRREGAAAAGARRLPRAAPVDPRRADQSPRRRQPRGAGARAYRIRGRRHPHQPRPPSRSRPAPTGCGSCATAP